MTTRHYLTLTESLSAAGAALVERNLRKEYEAGHLDITEYLHLTQEKRLTMERRNCRAYLVKPEPVQFERVPDEGLL